MLAPAAATCRRTTARRRLYTGSSNRRHRSSNNRRSRGSRGPCRPIQGGCITNGRRESHWLGGAVVVRSGPFSSGARRRMGMFMFRGGGGEDKKHHYVDWKMLPMIIKLNNVRAG